MNMRPGFDYRNDFAAALVDRAADAHPSGMDACAARRFRVYRNNVHGALISALADAYPVVQRLVGEDFFAAMAREFFLLESTRETSLALYGKGFAAFIDEFEPAASVAYLGDIARLERARLEALHALDAPVLDSSALPTDGEQLLAQSTTQANKDRLRANTEEAIARGSFGSPTILVGERLYFGNDQLPLVRMLLSGKTVPRSSA